jgi:hypothetical protein
MSTQYDSVPTKEIIEQAAAALKENGFDTHVVADGKAAIKVVTDIVPKGAEVLTVTSVTVDETGIGEVLNGEDYISVRAQLMELMGQEDKAHEQREIGSVPEVVVGSAHAITLDGKILVASATGSQIPAEVYGADKVIYVVGAQKITKDLNDGYKRIQEHSVPLEDKRALAAYGIHTSFNKLLVLNKERPGRISVVIVEQNIGY